MQIAYVIDAAIATSSEVDHIIGRRSASSSFITPNDSSQNTTHKIHTKTYKDKNEQK